MDDEKPTWDDGLGEEYDEVPDEEVEEHMVFGNGEEAVDDDGPINMVRISIPVPRVLCHPIQWGLGITELF